MGSRTMEMNKVAKRERGRCVGEVVWLYVSELFSDAKGVHSSGHKVELQGGRAVSTLDCVSSVT